MKSMLPTIQQDVWKPADQDDWRRALALLDRLPSRATSSAEFDQQVYFIALEGTTQYGLFEAVKAVLQGGLGHAFFPSPPELRIQCNEAIKHHVSMRDRVARQEQLRRERPPEVAPLTEEAKERQRQRMERFHASVDDGKAAERAAAVELERADIRARYGMTDEVVAGVRDNPLAKVRMGAKS
jgi:hypothetical protein